MSAPALPSPAPAPSGEYRTRLWMGLVMAMAACGVLVVDQYLAPWYPCLLVSTLLLAGLSTLEMHHLLRALPRPPLWLCLIAVCGVVLANWPAHVGLTGMVRPWHDVLAVFTGVVLLAFLWEMAVFRAPDGIVMRIALLVWLTAYLGILPSFFVQLRWWPGSEPSGIDLRGVTALALVIFVPKCSDIGAYFTGRLLGRHRMTPLLSPKKTWEGLAGGMAASMGVAVGINHYLAPLLGPAWKAAAFGLVVGIAGVLGDLAESMIKRDCGQKDASHVVPGFGGILDVVDSVLFAAPVVYWWLHGQG